MCGLSRSFFVVALVLLAGCGGLIGGDDSAVRNPTVTAPSTASASDEMATTTPARTAGTPVSGPTVTRSGAETPSSVLEPLTATPTAPPDLDPVSAVPAPPGLEGRNLSDPQALLERHNETVRSGTYRVVRRWNDTSGRHGGTRILTGETASLATLWAPATNRSTDYYFRGDGIALRHYSSGKILYGSGVSNVGVIAAMGSAFLYRVTPRYIERFEWRAIGSRTVDGEEQVVFVTNGTHSSRGDSSGRTVTGSAVPSVRGQMVVSSDGVIRNVHVTRYERANGSITSDTIEYRLTGLDETTVPRPDWFDRIPRINASLAEENRLLVVNHTGGAPIEPGTTLTVSSASQTNVTLDRRVTAGDTIYFHRTGAEGDRSVEVTVDERPTLGDSATPFSGNIIVRGNQNSVLFETGIEVGATE